MDQWFEYDIARCKLQDEYPDASCPKQTTCHRFLQNQKGGSEYGYFVLIKPEELTEDGCAAYWEEP